MTTSLLRLENDDDRSDNVRPFRRDTIAARRSGGTAASRMPASTSRASGARSAGAASPPPNPPSALLAAIADVLHQCVPLHESDVVDDCDACQANRLRPLNCLACGFIGTPRVWGCACTTTGLEECMAICWTRIVELNEADCDSVNIRTERKERMEWIEQIQAALPHVRAGGVCEPQVIAGTGASQMDSFEGADDGCNHGHRECPSCGCFEGYTAKASEDEGMSLAFMFDRVREIRELLRQSGANAER